MTTLMIYKKPVAIDRAIHRDLRVKLQAKGFAYAAKTNSVPLAAVEFGAACHEYPIVFITDEKDSGLPIALTGLRDDENLFVDAEGKWDAAYVPAFIRRYPFILQGDEGDEEFSVLIDIEADGVGAADGELLFVNGGENSQFLTSALDLLNEFRMYTKQTSEFVTQLRKLDLLIPRAINATTASGAQLSLDGFSVIDEARLNALGDADLLALARTGQLASIYAHLISLANVQKLLVRLEGAKV